MHILCVEPDEKLAATYAEYLELQGHSVAIAQTAQAAITCADTRRPDLVILELRLPRHSGVAFLQEFASYIDWQKIPIIIQSMASPRVLEQFRGSFTVYGVREVLYKPQTSLAYLGAVVGRYIQHKEDQVSAW